MANNILKRARYNISRGKNAILSNHRILFLQNLSHIFADVARFEIPRYSFLDLIKVSLHVVRMENGHAQTTLLKFA